MFRELKTTLATDRIHARILAGVVQEIDARCLHLAIAAFLDMATHNEHQTAGKQAWSACLTNRTTLLALIAIALTTMNDPDVLQRGAMAATTASRRAQRRRPGRRAQRAMPMFGKYGKKRMR